MNETLRISNNLSSNEQRTQIQAFIDTVKTEKENYSTEILWEMDKAIGGVGGYCMSPNPVINPFPGGIDRKLFSPLQYARSEIETCNVRVRACKASCSIQRNAFRDSYQTVFD